MAVPRRMTPKQATKAQATLLALVEALVLARGGRKPGSWYQMEILTKAGLLQVSVHDSVYSPWIACRFQDVAAAREHFGVTALCSWHRLNPYSGKWNFHDGETPQATFQAFERELLPLLLPA
jgi:hypothetical protein